MTWEHYELYSIDEDGNEELIDTDGSVKKLRQLVTLTLEEDEGIIECIIYQEDEEGELTELERISK